MIHETEQELNELGLIKPPQRRSTFRWILVVSVSLNAILINWLIETNKANEKVLHELLKKQFETTQKVDSLKVRL